jgi:hypothetical protein
LYLTDDGFAIWLRKLPNRDQANTVARANSLNEKYYPALLAVGAAGLCSAAFDLIPRRKA